MRGSILVKAVFVLVAVQTTFLLVNGQLEAVGAVLSVVPVTSILATAGLVGVKLAALSRLLHVLGYDQAYLASGGPGTAAQPIGLQANYAYMFPYVPGLNISVRGESSSHYENTAAHQQHGQQQQVGGGSSGGASDSTRKTYPAMGLPGDYENQMRPFRGSETLREIFRQAGIPARIPTPQQHKLIAGGRLPSQGNVPSQANDAVAPSGHGNAAGNSNDPGEIANAMPVHNSNQPSQTSPPSSSQQQQQQSAGNPNSPTDSQQQNNNNNHMAESITGANQQASSSSFQAPEQQPHHQHQSIPQQQQQFHHPQLHQATALNRQVNMPHPHFNRFAHLVTQVDPPLIPKPPALPIHSSVIPRIQVNHAPLVPRIVYQSDPSGQGSILVNPYVPIPQHELFANRIRHDELHIKSMPTGATTRKEFGDIINVTGLDEKSAALKKQQQEQQQQLQTINTKPSPNKFNTNFNAYPYMEQSPPYHDEMDAQNHHTPLWRKKRDAITDANNKNNSPDGQPSFRQATESGRLAAMLRDKTENYGMPAVNIHQLRRRRSLADLLIESSR